MKNNKARQPKSGLKERLGKATEYLDEGFEYLEYLDELKRKSSKETTSRRKYEPGCTRASNKRKTRSSLHAE